MQQIQNKHPDNAAEMERPVSADCPQKEEPPQEASTKKAALDSPLEVGAKKLPSSSDGKILAQEERDEETLKEKTEQPLWQALAEPAGRDYCWLATAMKLYDTQEVYNTRQSPPGAGCISFLPAQARDFGLQYGLSPGQTLHFLLEAQPQPAGVWTPLLQGLEGWFCIPVKTGRVGLGWQQGLVLQAIRPLALLRPFYLFGRDVRCEGTVRRVPLTDLRRLGRMLDSGWMGVGFCSLGEEVLLQKKVVPEKPPNLKL